MNSKTLLAVAAFAAIASSAVRADDITAKDITPFQSVSTRAEVQAELFQYKAAGVNPWSNRYNQLADFKSTKSREQVQAEYQANREAVAALTGEDSGSAYLAQMAVTSTAGTALAGTPVNAQ